MMKNESIMITQRRGNHGDLATWPCFNIDSQAEYSWKKNVVYLMGSAWCRVLRVAQTE